MARKTNVIITGSARGSHSAWIMSQGLLRLYGVHAQFFQPSQWDKKIQMDGLLITGGIDIDPRTFHTHKHFSTIKTDTQRDAMELFLLERAQQEAIPVMGICRGMQLINLFMGGTLHPHIPEMDLNFQHPHSVFPSNILTIEPKSRLHKILKTDRLKANALHHQTLKKIGKGLRVSARDTNALIQAIESTEENFTLGLQWHPEFMPYHWSTHRIFKAFAKEVKKQALF
ncbi:gamma-glutamyl-gamma-aminobutyrate hydrolase family protein [Sulfurimonas autotrophica]|uniref:Peptidase C26 n=1 Tax=Sulfurimonas autotrophica (strain ATCC BAA-671 / DSM 16294 / JCM 11897 / OK10) TaxID=563040 RepID=E0UPQ1_SULAO|nr:gamma-glutamyl-gamma-aminobutyrate hydrolase family protein [Sulfurimonas autotrophica]ADN08643.1 peptidase C26 [Sulfurimonas autotrophica DSM 16294]